MGSFHQQRSNKIMGTSRILIVALAAILAGGGAFAAVGGTESIRQFFVTLRTVGPDGEEVVQDLIVEKISETDEPSVLNLDLGDGKTATMQIDHINLNNENAVQEAATATLYQIQLGVEDNASNNTFFTNEVATVEDMNTTIEIKMGDDDVESTTTLGNPRPGTTMQRIGNFPKHVDTFELDVADIIHSWVDGDGVAYDLVLYGVSADDGNGDAYLFKAYEGDDGQRVFESIGQLSGVDPKLLVVTNVQMDKSAITLEFDNDGMTMKMIVNTGRDDLPLGKMRGLTIDSRGRR